jgi:osmoprotectant transport system permease protein
VLDDPKHAIPPYDAILLVSPKRAHDEKLASALKPLLGAISVDLMREANLRADGKGGKSSPDEIAKWLWERIENSSSRAQHSTK